MPRAAIPKTRSEKRFRRHLRVRKALSGTAERPRLVVFRSLKHITAQLVDDVQGRTLFTVTDTKLDGKKTEKSRRSGSWSRSGAKEAVITRVVFRPRRVPYHAA
jgi:large subunit ribosomal protein L18